MGTSETTGCIGYALVGAGAIAGVQAEALAGIPTARLVAVFNHTPEKARALGERLASARHLPADLDLRPASIAGLEVDGHLHAVEVVPEHEQERPLDARAVCELARAAPGEAEADHARRVDQSVGRPGLRLGRSFGHRELYIEGDGHR